MDVIAIFTSLSQAIGSYQSARDLLTNGVSEILEQIGRANYRAAIKALRDSKLSDDPDREIMMAVTQLRIAYASFRPVKTGWWQRFHEEISDAFGWAPPYEKWEVGSEVASLIATCYRALGDTPLFREWLTIAINEYVSFDRFELGQQIEFSRQQKWGGGLYSKSIGEQRKHCTVAFLKFVQSLRNGSELAIDSDLDSALSGISTRGYDPQ